MTTFIGISKYETPNINGHIYTKECMEKMVEQINNRAIPVVSSYEQISDKIYLKDIIGYVKKSSLCEEGCLKLEVDLFDKHKELEPKLFSMGWKVIGDVDPEKRIHDVEVVAFVPLPKHE